MEALGWIIVTFGYGFVVCFVLFAFAALGYLIKTYWQVALMIFCVFVLGWIWREVITTSTATRRLIRPTITQPAKK